MRWLGVYFDPCLLFSDYIAKMASKSWKAALSLFILVKTTKGIKVGIMQKIVYSYILPILTYKILAWWPG